MMTFYSTNNRGLKVSLKEAVLSGLAPDGGLYMPESITPLSSDFFRKIHSMSFQEIAFTVGKHLLQGAIPEEDLKHIIEESLSFDAPIVKITDSIYSLELFHGPTLSFKDFGARFLARLTAYLIQGQSRDLNILVATSGDTGSAVGYGFFNVPGIKVYILYPKGLVTPIQEKQLTTIGSNVTAVEVDGLFDDCQAMVKRAFNDNELCQRINLTSANSINIGRLIPQSFYYFYAYAQLKNVKGPITFSVPSGNFGNLMAGLLAKEMGLPVERFIAATNINDIVPEYLRTGIFKAHPSKSTISNAMDVGNPSNFARILDLYKSDLNTVRKNIFGASFTDAQTIEAMKELFNNYNYIADPHGAVAYLGLKSYQQQIKNTPGIFLETADPAKFIESVEPAIGKKIHIPERLQKTMSKEKQAVTIRNHYDDLKNLLI